MKWSIYAHNCFRRCQRQYYFSELMASHNAKDKRRREAYILRQLQSLSAWRGSLFDKGVELFVIPSLKNGEVIDYEWVVQQTLSLAQRQFAFSEARKYRNIGSNKGAVGEEFCALFPHEYDLGISSDELKITSEHITLCFENLGRQEDLMRHLRNWRWYGVQITLSFSVDKVPIIARLDLIFFRNKGQLTIVDWKTGSSETSDHRHQLHVYALAASRRWAATRLEEMEILEVNLAKNEVRRHTITQQDLLDTEDFIYMSISEIRLITQGDKFSIQHIEDYEFANNPNTCKYCSFRKLCLLEVSDEYSSSQFVRDCEPVQLEMFV